MKSVVPPKPPAKKAPLKPTIVSKPAPAPVFEEDFSDDDEFYDDDEDMFKSSTRKPQRSSSPLPRSFEVKWIRFFFTFLLLVLCQG